MAQHIPIENIKIKGFADIEKAIRKAFLNPHIKGSLKYIYEDTGFYSEHENDEVYLMNNKTGSFEIHFNRKTRTIENIYFVA